MDVGRPWYGYGKELEEIARRDRRSRICTGEETISAVQAVPNPNFACQVYENIRSIFCPSENRGAETASGSQARQNIKYNQWAGWGPFRRERQSKTCK